MRTCCWKSHASAGKYVEAPVRETFDTAFALSTDSTRVRDGVAYVWCDYEIYTAGRVALRSLFHRRRFSFVSNLMLSVFFLPKIVFARKTTRTIYLSVSRHHRPAVTACYVFIVFAVWVSFVVLIPISYCYNIGTRRMIKHSVKEIALFVTFFFLFSNALQVHYNTQLQFTLRIIIIVRWNLS